MVPVYRWWILDTYPFEDDGEKYRLLIVDEVVDTEVTEDAELLLVVELIEVLLGREGLLRLEKDDTVESDGDKHGSCELALGVLNCDIIDSRLILGLGVVLYGSIWEARAGVWGVLG